MTGQLRIPARACRPFARARFGRAPRPSERQSCISANALSRWRNDGLGLRHWDGFDGRHLGLVSHHKVALDSAGFVAASRYRGFPWSTHHYLDLAAAAPWLWWAELAKVPPA